MTGGTDMTFVNSQSHFTEARSQKTSEVVGKIDAAWLADAEFCFLVAREVEAPPVVLPVTIEKFTIRTS